MANSNSNLFSSRILVIGAAVVLAAAISVVFLVGGGRTGMRIRSAVADIAAGNNAGEARRELMEANDRGAVLAALKEALEDDDDNVTGKQEIIATLYQFKEQAPIERALSSKVPATRYAAAFVLYRYPQHAEQCRQVAIEWLADADSPYRDRAVELADRLQLKETIPELLSILDEGAQGKKIPLPLMRAVLTALGHLKPPGTAAKVLIIARDENQDPNARTIALRTLGQMDEADAEAIAKLLLEIMSDPTQSKVLRMTAGAELRLPKYRSDEATAAFERILLDGNEHDVELQRLCLHRLGAVAPIERLQELMKDPRVYKHKYFGIRSDVGTAMHTLHMRDKVSFDILCNHLLVDEDKKDTEYIVRLEAWESLWLMTGRIAKVEEADLFKNRPPYGDVIDRESLFWYSWRRHGITRPMVLAMRKITGNLTEMGSLRDIYTNQWQDIKGRWVKEEARLQEQRDKQKKDEEDFKKKLEDAKKKKDDAEKKNEGKNDDEGK